MSGLSGTNDDEQSVTALNIIRACFTGGYNSIEFGSDITSIGYSAFKNCPVFSCGSLIKNIYILGAISSIEENAFCGCASLQSISLPETGVTLSYIGTGAFIGCTNFTGFIGGTLTISGTTIPAFGAGAFYGCASLNLEMLDRIQIAATNTAIQKNGSKALGYIYFAPVSGFTLGDTSMYMPGSGCLIAGSIPSDLLPSSIAENAFLGCASLQSISLSETGVTLSSIGDNAFQDCADFTGFIGGTLTIGGTTTAAIGLDAFYGCASLNLEMLDRIQIAATNTAIQKNGSKALGYIYFAPVSGFTLGDTKMYSRGAGCLIAGSIPSDLLPSSIGRYAFGDCASLNSISIPKTGIALSSIDAYAFYRCTNFTGFIGGTLTIVGTTIAAIDEYAFANCASLNLEMLDRIQIAATNTAIQKNGSKALGYIYFAPVSGFTLGDTSMYMPGSGCLIAGSIPSDLLPSSIGRYAFAYCASLTKIDLSSVTSIDEGAFSECVSLNNFLF
ncbi:hypothetical protein FACS1894166_02970 [Bacilli bacterium]|nr:hypothetical protein FACS1894166_02970 [Bacilli bacterium]